MECIICQCPSRCAGDDRIDPRGWAEQPSRAKSAAPTNCIIFGGCCLLAFFSRPQEKGKLPWLLFTSVLGKKNKKTK